MAVEQSVGSGVSGGCNMAVEQSVGSGVSG